MWTCLLLLGLCAKFAGSVDAVKCPTNCSCDANDAATSLVVNCHNRTDIETDRHLSNEIDSLLSSSLYDRLTWLYIVNTSLTLVPRSVCRLTSLTLLNLNNNRLTRLPDNCFTNLSNLVLFSAARNAIETLQDGIFDGLTKLEQLELSDNSISHIDLSVCRLMSLNDLFLNSNRLTQLPDNCLINLSNLVHFFAYNNTIETLQDGVFDGLPKLEYLDLSFNRISSISLSVFAEYSLGSLINIDLSHNNLTSLEPWIFNLAAFRTSVIVSINLSNNKISKFANKMGSNIQCDELWRMYRSVVVSLERNEIQYFIDILSGWQLDIALLNHCRGSSYLGMGARLFIMTDGNNIACDCVNYHFVRMVESLHLQNIWRTATCNLTDPLTGNSSMENVFDTNRIVYVCELTERCPAGCVCVHRPANSTIHVYCSNTNLTVLPLELPELPENRTKYKLDFCNNRHLRRLEHRDYFVNTSILDVTNSGVDDILDWEEIVNIPDINLFGNNITSLPVSFSLINITTGKLNLANNPWDCTCNSSWMSDWLNSIADRLADTVRCDSPSRLRGKNIMQMTHKDFCVDPTDEAVTRAVTISLSLVAHLVLLLFSVGFIIYRRRVKLYTKWKFHPFDRDECLGEDMDYDVFLCCSSEDHHPYAVRILELMESKGYSVYYHERDFLPGELITDNICRGIERSKRTACLLSENFRRSSFCMLEFRAAFHHHIVEKQKTRLIVLMMLDSPAELLADDAEDTAALRQFLRQYTYIDYTADDWLDRLLYALPLRGLLQRNEHPDNERTSAQ